MRVGVGVARASGRARRGDARWNAPGGRRDGWRPAVRRVDGAGGARATARGTARDARERLDAATRACALVGMGPLVALTAPQLMKNFASVAAGDPGAVAAVSWEAYAAGMLGNMLLLSYFAEKREPVATAAQAVGAMTSFALLVQIAWSGNMPEVAGAEACAASAFVLGGTALSLARYFGRAGGELVGKVWDAYQTALGALGVLAAPQIACNALFNGAFGWLPGELALLALVIAARAEKLPAKWSECSGWTATLLFMMMPVAQIAHNLHSPEALHGLSVLTSVFITSGNAMMLLRAIFVRDLIWIIGSAWAAYVGGWGVLATLFGSINPSTGERYLGELEFAAITITLLAYTVIFIGGSIFADFAQTEEETR